jgi:hypothetical protein
MGMLDDDDWWRRQQQQPGFGGENLAPMDDIEPGRGLLRKIGDAVATMPSVQGIKDFVTTPGDVLSGKAPMGLPTQTDPEVLDRGIGMGIGMTGGGSVSRLAGGIPEGAIGTFAGPYAKNAPIKNYQLGAKLERKGASPEEIWQEAQVFRDPARNWSHEIPNLKHDFYPEIKNRGGEVTDRMPTLFHAPEVVTAYPDLAQVVMSRKATGARTEPLGSFSTITSSGEPRSIKNSPYISVEGPKNTLRETAIHELNHAVDLAEGRFGTTSPDYKGSRAKSIREYVESPEERMARAAANRRDYTPDQLREIHPLKTPEDPFYRGVLDRFAQEDMRRQMVEPKTGLLTRIKSGWM